MFQASFGIADLEFMLGGAGITLAITFWSVLIGSLFGILFGLLLSEGPSYVGAPIGLVLDVFRSVPLLIQFVLSNSLNSMTGADLPTFHVGCLVLSVYTAAYLADLVRAGIIAVPSTTRRAARSLGLTYIQDLTEITGPIAIKVVLPNWIGLALGVMKDTSLVLWIGISELLRTSQSVVTRTQEPLLVLGIAGLIYFLMSFPVARLGTMLERRWATND